MTSEEAKKISLKVERRFKKAVDTYGLIPRGSTVIAAISGGKDSLCMLDLLTRDRFRKHYGITVVAVHVVMENVPYHADLDFIQTFCEKREIELMVRKTQFEYREGAKKSACYLCSWQRRKVLYAIAREKGTGIIALGHHQDDMVETLLMNMAFQGSISSMPPKMKMSAFDMTMIRPLALISNKQLEDYAALRQFPKMKKECPHEEASSRSDIRAVIEQLGQLNPKARSNIFASMSHIQEDYLPGNGINK